MQSRQAAFQETAHIVDCLLYTSDMTRETSPLKQADDAVLLDSSDMTIDEVVDRMKQLSLIHI